MRGICLGFNNLVVTGEVWDVRLCLGYGGMGGVGGVRVWLGKGLGGLAGVMSVYVVSLDSLWRW